MAKKTWLEEFEKNPPSEFPIELKHGAENQEGGIGVFQDLDEFRNGVLFAKTKLGYRPRESINRQKTKNDALCMLWRQLHANDYFQKYQKVVGMREIKSLRMSELRAQQELARIEKQRATWNRIKDDAAELFNEVNAELDRDDLDHAMLHTLAGQLGSLVTRIKYQTGKGPR